MSEDLPADNFKTLNTKGKINTSAKDKNDIKVVAGAKQVTKPLTQKEALAALQPPFPSFKPPVGASGKLPQSKPVKETNNQQRIPVNNNVSRMTRS